MYRTPTSTRSYKSKGKMDAEEYFSLGHIVTDLGLDDEEFDAVFKAAVAATAYRPARGQNSPFPPPVQFIEDFFGMDEEDMVDAWEREIRDRSLGMLRAAAKLGSYLSKNVNDLAFARFDIACPICDRPDIEVTLGFGVRWERALSNVMPNYDSVRMIALSIECSCQGFNTTDFDVMEEIAKEEVRVRL